MVKGLLCQHNTLSLTHMTNPGVLGTPKPIYVRTGLEEQHQRLTSGCHMYTHLHTYPYTHVPAHTYTVLFSSLSGMQHMSLATREEYACNMKGIDH